jgi:hypothetical protein
LYTHGLHVLETGKVPKNFGVVFGRFQGITFKVSKLKINCALENLSKDSHLCKTKVENYFNYASQRLQIVETRQSICFYNS